MSKKSMQAKRDAKAPSSDLKIKVRIAGEDIYLGPDAVPSSPFGAKRTNIKKLIAGFKEASRQGLFEQDLSYGSPG